MLQLPYKVITPPTIYPISVDATLKAHCRISATDTSEDALLLEYIKAATEYIERYIGYPLMTQVIEVKVEKTILIKQPLTGNIVGLTTYTYYNGSADVLDTDASSMRVDTYGLLSYVINDAWPSGTDYRIKCNAGYTVDNVKDDLKQACRLLVMHMYEMREASKIEAPDTVTERLDRHLLY